MHSSLLNTAAIEKTLLSKVKYYYCRIF